MEKTCEVCGSLFHADEHWKKKCLPCWKKENGYDKAKFNPQPKVKYIKVPVYIEVGSKMPDGMVNKLLRLCHPDKHGNSSTSNEVTRWLLEQRTK